MRVKVKVELNEQLFNDVIIRYRKTWSNKIFVFGYHGRESKTYYFIVDTFDRECNIELIMSLIIPQHINIKSIEDISAVDMYLKNVPLLLLCNDIINQLQIDCYSKNKTKTRYFNQLLQAREILNDLL